MEVANTALPTSVRKQAEEAEALHRKMYPDQYPKADGEQTGKDPVAAKPAEEAKDTLNAKLPEQPKPAEAKVEGTAEEWKQRYDTLQGKYNAEVPQLHGTANALRIQLQEALTRIQTLEADKAKGAGGPDNGKGTGAGEEEVVDPSLKAFKEEYPDIFDAVKKMVQPKAPEVPKPAEVKVDPATPPAAATEARQTMLYTLGRDIPDWKEVNKDPEFIKSLEAFDPKAGMTKLQALNQAFNANDSATVIGFFRDYKAAKAAAPVIDANAKLGPDGKPLTAEELALAPPKGGRPPGGPQGDQIAVTPQDLAKFYDQARRGLWGSITEQKYRTEEARLLAALMKART